jgi:hypothetical protein
VPKPWYIQLAQAEAAFRTSKTDPNLHPVFHQVAGREQTHVLVCFLSLAVWRVLKTLMSVKGFENCARQLLLQLDAFRSMVLPTREAGAVRLRVVAKPDKALAQLLIRPNVELPNVPKSDRECSPENGVRMAEFARKSRSDVP